ncbi:MAG: hypothetical protein J4G18_15265, partial [Anaerolineae bacterium]|nr:hypothetical protein [Anaerolineae bacterium]
NEPIGCMTIEYLSQRLCEDDALRQELGLSWHFIKSIDADGMRLNEGWFDGPFTPTNYARHFYRPARREQVEWTFPIEYKSLSFDDPLPETRALMRVIDETQPTLLYSLHNAGFGGVYYYISGACPPLYDTFHQIPEWFGLALDLGEPEMSFAAPYAPAIYRMLSSTDMYDHLERNGIADPAAAMGFMASSAQYAERYGSFFLIVEMPYFEEPRVNDQSLSTTLRRDAILQALDMATEHDAWIREQYAPVESALRLDSPVRRALEDFLAMSAGFREADRQWVMNDESTNRPATQAELFSNLYTSRFYRLLNVGLLARLLADEIASGNDHRQIQAASQAATERLNADGGNLEAELDYRAIPIRSLVGVQCCAGLATAAYLKQE